MKRALLLLATMLASPVAAQTVAITNATVALGDGSAPIEGGTVVFQNGRITAAGRGVAVPAGAEVIDGSGKWVAPGFVAGFSDLGITDAAGVAESNDAGARTSPFNAAIDVSVSINPAEVKVANERRGGVTRALVAPEASGSIFAGEGAVIDLGNDPQPVTRARAFQFVELGEGGGRLAGGSRPAAYAMLRDALSQAQDYRRNPGSFGGREKDSLVKRGDAEALLRVLDGAVPLVVHVERASDILTVLALPRDYPKLKLVLTGVSEGWMVAREIAAARVPVIAAALADLPAQCARQSPASTGRAAAAAGAVRRPGPAQGDRRFAWQPARRRS